VAVILLVMVSDLKHKHAMLTRQLASLRLKMNQEEKSSLSDRVNT
jgi:hypothetical protein